MRTSPHTTEDDCPIYQSTNQPTGPAPPNTNYTPTRREVIQSYGYEYLFTLANLESAGLLYRRPELGIGFGSSSSGGGSGGSSGADGGNWAAVRKALRLVKENVRTLNPDDIAYVSSGACFDALCRVI